jgi:predicted  nucleic acid-binding Zn-ribbon protein
MAGNEYMDLIRLEHRMSTIEAQYKQLYDLLERHNNLNEKLEKRLDDLGDTIRRQGWALASTFLGVILSIIITLTVR